MKPIIRTFALCLVLMSFVLVSCDSEDNTQPIRLEDENPQVIFDNDGRTISLYAYHTEGSAYVVRGGAGTYTAQSQDERVAVAVCNGTQLLVRPVGAGSTTVTISDAAGQTYLLSVEVGYPYVAYVVIGQHIELQGDGLTDDDKDSYPALTYAYYLQVAVMQHSGLLTEPIIGGR